MSFFVDIPDGYFQESRLDEQLSALPRLDQFHVRHLFIVMTIAAAAAGGVKAIMDYANTPAIPIAESTKK